MADKIMPVDHLSYSSFMQLLRNPLIFKLQEVLHIYNRKSSLSAMIGKACHEALQVYYGGNDTIQVPANVDERRAVAQQHGLDYLTGTSDDFIDYGKTGNREEMLKKYAQAMQYYWAEEPSYTEILACETKLSAEMITKYGDKLPLPATGKPDLVVRTAAGDVEIIDTKFTRTHTDYETEDYAKIIQSQFLYHLVKGAMGVEPKRIVYREIKITGNKNGEPQVRDWVVPYDHEPYFIMFYNLYRDVVKYLANDPVFLPNLGDMYDGEHAGMMYAQGLINADMSDVEVMHKTKDVILTSKKFVTSNLERAENKDLPLPEKIKMRLAEFGIPVEPAHSIEGPQITRHLFKVSAGVRMATILRHQADIERTVASTGSIKILAPVPGTEYLGIEVENEQRHTATLGKEHIKTGTFNLPVGIGIDGNVHYLDLREAPHLLIAGATGTGKSVAINTILSVLTRQLNPEELELVLVDPKQVELYPWADTPHVTQTISEPAEVSAMLESLLHTMHERYKLLKQSKKRDLETYNNRPRARKKLPYIVVVIDEFADLILQDRTRKRKKGEEEYVSVEHAITRLAQMGRAAGIHIVLATQRPSVDVITGLIKANFPTRIAFRTASPTDSQVILGDTGAEKLSGKGDLLLTGPTVRGGTVRLQGLLSQ